MNVAERKRYSDEIDRKATALYDRLNPDWTRTINVSKAECIRRVMVGERTEKPTATQRRLASPAERKVVRAAFQIVRNDPAERLLRQNFVAVLAGKAELTDILIESAEQILLAAETARAAAETES